MKKRTAQKIIIASVLLVSSLETSSVMAATENELRQLVGLGNAETKEQAEAQARAIISSCTQDQTYNELVDMLKMYGLDDYNDQVELATKGQESYTQIMEAFHSGKGCDEVLSMLSAYETYHENYEETVNVLDMQVDKISEADIEDRMKYAEAILDSVNNTDEIGLIGEDAPLITNEYRLYINKMTDDAVTVQAPDDKKILAMFNGKADDVGNNYITIKSGATIYVTFYGINPSVKRDDVVLQNELIGECVGDEVEITLNIVTRNVNPLLVYGQKASKWCEEYVNATPWEDYQIDLSDYAAYEAETDEAGLTDAEKEYVGKDTTKYEGQEQNKEESDPDAEQEESDSNKETYINVGGDIFEGNAK